MLEACALARDKAQGTRYARSTETRRFLHYLHEEFGAPKLWHHVPKITVPDPRNVTVTTAERDKILNAADDALKCWLLLCSDLAIRSTTAAAIAPAHFNGEAGTISFPTKFGTTQTLPVTAALRALFAKVASGADATKPYVAHLSRLGRACAPWLRVRFHKLRRSLGITRHITPHDLRRSTAVRTLDVTKDLRIVQALLGHRDLSTTLYYLDHRNTTVQVSTLELAKLNPTTERTQ